MAPPKPWGGGGGEQESGGYCEACSRGREGNFGATGGSCIGFKGCEYHGILQGVQAKTADKAGYVIPVEITVYDDKSFTFILKTPPASVLLKKAAGVEKGSKEPKLEKVGKITIDQLRPIAKEKFPHLNCTTIESAVRLVAGTPANKGIYINPPVLEPKKALV